KGITLLKQNGFLGFITSNKWMRAGYGKTTRNYFLENTQPQLLVDLGSGIFDEATVDSNLLLLKKTAFTHAFNAIDISKEKHVRNLYLFSEQALQITPETNENWAIASEIEQSIKAKIEAKGVPLKDWDIQIYRGILTGYNEAFIISGQKKDELIAQDPKSAEIIKPILRGRDIKRYKAEFADLWLIYVPWHFPLHNDSSIVGVSQIAEELFAKKYPAIYKHLLIHKDALSSRNKAETGIRYEWYALQRWAANYYQEFEKVKIAWNRIASIKQFSLIEKDILIQDSMHFITGNNLVYLSAILNSNLLKWLLNLIVGVSVGGNAGNSDNIKMLPIPPLSETDQEPFIELVNQILAKKENGEDTTALEAAIDQLVYQLYGLTDEEIKIVEKNT
ncbi:MAG: class I SAM-dependent DNA methyltransferase, partial [Chitinophagales bacterium]|nr:class I SAM-dependent DNA methyltransferase [Chitinophagales bacterium]